MLGSRQRSRELEQGRSAAGLGSHTGDAQPCGKPQPWALSMPMSVGRAEPPRWAALVLWPGSGPKSSSPVHCPAAQHSDAGTFHTMTAPAGSAAPPSQSQTLPEAKSCSIYWPQAELTAAS